MPGIGSGLPGVLLLLSVADPSPGVRQTTSFGRRPEFDAPDTGNRFLGMATLESVRTLLATFYAYHDKDFGEVVFDRILIVGDRVLLTGHRGADRFTSVFSVDDGGVRRVQDYASVDAALDALKRPRT
jgi:hypothetical protein